MPLDLAPLAEPAKILVERISDLIGGAAKPFQIRRVAKAEADALLIETNAEIEATDLQRRAAQRWLDEETRNQANMEKISAHAVEQISSNANPAAIETDWLTNFFDKARHTSDVEMQKLWAKLLAEEANVPGRFSRHTVNTVAELEKSDAELFQRLCRAVLHGDSGPFLFIMDHRSPVYQPLGLTWENLSHLSDIGLVFLDWIQGSYMPPKPSPDGNSQLPLVFQHGGEEISVVPLVETGLHMGNIKFTRAGRELAVICGYGEPVDGLLRHAAHWWERQNQGRITWRP